MKKKFIDTLIDYETQEPFELVVEEEQNDHIIRGQLRSTNGKVVPIVNGVPRFVGEVSDSSQEQTQETFGDLWNHECRQDNFGGKGEMHNLVKEQILAVVGVDTEEELKELFKGKTTLNAGCGQCWTEDVFNGGETTTHLAFDISTSVDAAFRRTHKHDNVLVAQADVFELPVKDESVDLIYSIGVLHHTPNPPGAFAALAKKLKKGGKIGVYIYNVKPFLREMADMEIRKKTTDMSYEECDSFCKGLTALGKSLQRIQEELVIDEDIALLGIKKGTYNVQQFVYDHFVKCFYNEGVGDDISTTVNVDWYLPKCAFHYTLDDLKNWFSEAGIGELDVRQPSGWEHSGYFISGIKQ